MIGLNQSHLFFIHFYFRKQEDRKILEARKRKKKKDFDKEMADFLNLRKEISSKKEVEMEEGEKEGGEGKEEEEMVELNTNPFSTIIKSLSGGAKKAEHPGLERWTHVNSRVVPDIRPF